MSADYEKIREENIARYGWDTAVLDLLGQLYSERTHFIFELIQNAEDAGATELSFELFDDRLEVRHDGRPFTEADVRGVCGVGQSRKSLTSIGQFGIGFKSVYAYTKTPRVYSPGEHFRIENYVRPFPVPPVAGLGAQTLFVFPLDHDTVPASVALDEISAALNALRPGTLLFLASIARLRAGGVGVAGSVIERSVTEGIEGIEGIERVGRVEGIERVGRVRRVEGIERVGRVEGIERVGRVEGIEGVAGIEGVDGTPRRVTLAKGRRKANGGQREEWLVWSRRVEGLGAVSQPIEIAFLTAAGQITSCGDAPLSVFFPTEKQTYLGFVVQGPYRTTPARDNVPEHDPSNRSLVGQTAALLADVLDELAADGLLTVEVLQALPLEATRFPPGSMFRPLFDAVREALSRAGLIPAAEGGYRAAADLKLARGADVLRLLDPGQLGALYGAGRAVWFAEESISESSTPVLWRYLREEIGIEEVAAEDVVERIGAEFLRAQSDEWIVRLYAFLFAYSALWRAARVKPIIRLEDGSQVAAFDAADRPDRPAVYLPGPAASSLPTVRRAVAEHPAARPFLDALNLAEPDVVAEVLELVLPRYDRTDIAELDLAQHDADLDLVVRALDEAAAGRRHELLERLRQTAFLIGENAATGEQRLITPPALYQRAKDLEVYFDGNPDIWFAADRYGPWLVQLRGMRVRQAVEIRARTPDPLGYVTITVEFGRNERGLDGFDPDAAIDGLDFALGHPSHDRSEYVWNALLAPNRRLITGAVERSVLQSFADSSREGGTSAIGLAAGREAWLPGRDGTFRRPGELSLDDLPPTYTRDEGLAQALGMLRPVVAEAARQLGIPPAVLWGLSARPDLVAMIERQLGEQPLSILREAGN